MLAVAQITIRDENDVVIGATEPSSPVKDMLWLDTAVVPHRLKRWSGSAWVECGTDVDLSAYYTKTEVNTRFEQTNQAISSKAESSTVSSLGERVARAEEKVTPEAIASTVASSALYAYEKYTGRNYCLNSAAVHSFVDNKYLNVSGVATTSTGIRLSVSDDLFAHSGNGKYIRISLDIKRTAIDAAAAERAAIYSGIFIYYDYIASDGTKKTGGLGYYLRTTDASFVATDDDWTRIHFNPLDLSSNNPVGMAYLYLGTSYANGATGTVQFRNIKLEAMDGSIEWSAAPEDIYGLSNRVTNAESSILQNARNIALKVNTSTYNADKIYRGNTAPATPTENMLWLDTSVSPNLLKRYNASTKTWEAAGAEELKSSGVYIGPNNVAITTENFLLQLLDPANNENVLMEMSANGNVGFKELYADNVISDSVAPAYTGPHKITVDPSYSGASDTYFRSLGEAVKRVNNQFLNYDVFIYLPDSGDEIYEPEGTQIRGISGPGSLSILGYSSRLNSYVTVKGCSAHIYFYNVSLREIRALNGTNRNPYLIELQTNHYVDFRDCTLDANDVTYDSIFCCATHACLQNCGLYNAKQGLEVFKGWAYTEDCKGACSWAMIAYAGYIIASGTVPDGSRRTGKNGQIFDSGVTVDYGTAAPVAPPETTWVAAATLTKSYRGGWRSDTNDVIQGVYSDSGYKSSLSWNYGCMWFTTLRSALSGKKVKSATLTLHRKTGSGSSSAKTFYLYPLNNTSPSGAPSLPAAFPTTGTIGRNESVTVAVSADIVQGLVDGTYGGLCLFEPKHDFGSSTYSTNYMRMSGTDDAKLRPYLTIVCNG